MNPTSLYITTSRLVFQGDIASGLQDLNRLLPYLRKSLSCAVCCKLLVEPHSPSTADCQHHICRMCVGKNKKLKPACRFCKGMLQYRENTQMRLLLQCYKSICTFIRTRPIYSDIRKCAAVNVSDAAKLTNAGTNEGESNGTPTSLMDLIEEGASFVDDFKCHSGLSKSAYSILPCVFPPLIVSQSSTLASELSVTEQVTPCCSKALRTLKSNESSKCLAIHVGKREQHQQMPKLQILSKIKRSHASVNKNNLKNSLKYDESHLAQLDQPLNRRKFQQQQQQTKQRVIKTTQKMIKLQRQKPKPKSYSLQLSKQNQSVKKQLKKYHHQQAHDHSHQKRQNHQNLQQKQKQLQLSQTLMHTAQKQQYPDQNTMQHHSLQNKHHVEPHQLLHLQKLQFSQSQLLQEQHQQHNQKKHYQDLQLEQKTQLQQLQTNQLLHGPMPKFQNQLQEQLIQQQELQQNSHSKLQLLQQQQKDHQSFDLQQAFLNIDMRPKESQMHQQENQIHILNQQKQQHLSEDPQRNEDSRFQQRNHLKQQLNQQKELKQEELYQQQKYGTEKQLHKIDYQHLKPNQQPKFYKQHTKEQQPHSQQCSLQYVQNSSSQSPQSLQQPLKEYKSCYQPQKELHQSVSQNAGKPSLVHQKISQIQQTTHNQKSFPIHQSSIHQEISSHQKCKIFVHQKLSDQEQRRALSDKLQVIHKPQIYLSQESDLLRNQEEKQTLLRSQEQMSLVQNTQKVALTPEQKSKVQQQQIKNIMQQQNMSQNTSQNIVQNAQALQQPGLIQSNNVVDVVIRPSTSSINSNVSFNAIIPSRVSPAIIDPLANRSLIESGISKNIMAPMNTGTSLASQKIVKNSCLPTTPRIVNITTPQEIKFEAAPIKTVSNGSTMYSVLYAESSNKFTIKRKPDPVTVAMSKGLPSNITSTVSNTTANLRSVISTASIHNIGVAHPKITSQNPQLTPQINNSLVLQFQSPQNQTSQLPTQPHRQQQNPSVMHQLKSQMVPRQISITQLSPVQLITQNETVNRTQEQYNIQQYQLQQIQSQQFNQNTLLPQQAQNFNSSIIQEQLSKAQSSQFQQVSQPNQQQLSKRKGCRCGNATPTPGKLTCCGQRCPCYVDSKSCIDCKCRGCRNPHRADGLKIRRSLSELLQQYNTPVSTSNTEDNITSIINTSGTLGFGSTVTPVTYSISATKSGNESISASSCAKVKVISAGQNQALQITAKSPLIASVIKTGAGRIKTNGGVGISFPGGANSVVPTSSMVTIRPLASNTFTNRSTATINYLPSMSLASSTSSTIASPQITLVSPFSVPNHQAPIDDQQERKNANKLEIEGSVRSSGNKLSATLTANHSYDGVWTNLKEPAICSKLMNLATDKASKRIATSSGNHSDKLLNVKESGIKMLSGYSEIKDVSSVIAIGKPDALLSQSSVALLPVASSSVATYSNSNGIWSSLSPNNQFCSNPASISGSTGNSVSASELPTISGYDVNSFVNLSHMLDPEGVINLCDDLELTAVNLMPIE